MVLNQLNEASDGRSYDPALFDNSTPVLLLGGQANTLALCRSYGRRGVPVRVSGSSEIWAARSRFCRQSFVIPKGVREEDFWADLLLSGKHPELEGHALIYCNDAAIEFVAKNRQALEERYLLDDSKPEMQLALLDKLETLKLARQTGVGAPNYWLMESEADFERVRAELNWPVIVKPLISHEFQAVFGTKFFRIDGDFDELVRRVRQCWEAEQPIMLVEQIPGPDTLLSSYYTYIDREGHSYFDYTKRVIRRYPMNMGGGTYHESAWMPETAKVGRQFFDGIGFTGFGNVEFKRDPRDNTLKIIEANARFTAAQELVARSEAPLDLIYYCRLTKQPAPTFSSFREGVRYWYLIKDFRAFVEMRRKGLITFPQWVKSVFPFNHASSLYDWRDPWPSVVGTVMFYRAGVQSLIARRRRARGDVVPVRTRAAARSTS